MKIKRIDTEEANKIALSVKENDGYCPCRIKKTPETKCMCQDFLFQTAPCICLCGLYEKVYEGTNDDINNL